MMLPLGNLCIIDINKSDDCNLIHLKKITYSQILMNIFNIEKGQPSLYIPFQYDKIRSIWVKN